MSTVKPQRAASPAQSGNTVVPSSRFAFVTSPRHRPLAMLTDYSPMAMPNSPRFEITRPGRSSAEMIPASGCRGWTSQKFSP